MSNVTSLGERATVQDQGGTSAEEHMLQFAAMLTDVRTDVANYRAATAQENRNLDARLANIERIQTDIVDRLGKIESGQGQHTDAIKSSFDNINSLLPPSLKGKAQWAVLVYVLLSSVLSTAQAAGLIHNP